MAEKGKFVLAIEKSYGWVMSEKDHEKLKELARNIGSGSEVINMLKVWRDEIKGRPVPIDDFIRWEQWEVKREPVKNPQIEDKYIQIEIW